MASQDRTIEHKGCAELVVELNRRGIDLGVRGSNILIRGDITDADRARLRAAKTEVVAYLSRLSGLRVGEYNTIHGVPLGELQTKADSDWRWIAADTQALDAFARLVATNNQLDAGIVPDHWTEAATCRSCGDVPIFPGAGGADLWGCPWCLRGGFKR